MSETTERLDAIEVRLASARPGPWLVNDEEHTVRVESAEGDEWGGEIMYDRSAEHHTYWVSEFRPDAVFIANAPTDIAYLLTLARKQAAALDAVRALHKPEKRWMPYDGAGISFDTEKDALEAAQDVDLGVVAIEEQAEHGTPFFEVCAHCKTIEEGPCDGECTIELGYRESLWPCLTISALEATQ